MIVAPFERSHLENMVVQTQQQGLEHLLTDDIYATLANNPSYSALDGDEVVACAGTIEVAPGRALAWAYISQNAGTRMVRVTKSVKRFLDMAPYRRIEMDVDCDFVQAHRWARLLGFKLECLRRVKFTPDGRDCALYARVQGE